MKKVSLKVIADALGVSTATAAVSPVLNGKNQYGRVSEETSRKTSQKASDLFDGRIENRKPGHETLSADANFICGFFFNEVKRLIFLKKRWHFKLYGFGTPSGVWFPL